MMTKRIMTSIAASMVLVSTVAAGTVYAAPARATNRTATVSLHGEHGSHASGTAVLNYNSRTRITTVSLLVTGLKPMSVHPAHIHLGHNCAANGPVLYTFRPLSSSTMAKTEAGNNGVMRASLSFRGSYTVRSLYVNVHEGPGLATKAQFTPIVCGVVR